jgi:hypothetical protein
MSEYPDHAICPVPLLDIFASIRLGVASHQKFWNCAIVHLAIRDLCEQIFLGVSWRKNGHICAKDALGPRRLIARSSTGRR